MSFAGAHRWLAYLPFVAGCIAIYLVSDMPRPPVPDALSFRFSDKLMHACAYGVLAWLALFGAWRRRGGLGRASFLEAIALAALYGVSDELHQSFVPNRTATVGDAIADAVGAMLFVGLVAAWLRARAKPGAPIT